MDDDDAASDAPGQTEPSIFGESQPETSTPQVISASEHSQHPFFSAVRTAAAARGKGKGGGGGRGGRGRGGRGGGGDGAAAAGSSSSNNNDAAIVVPDSEDRPSFGPISLKELEFAHRKNADGAESAMWSDDDDDDDCGGIRRPKKRKKKAKKKRKKNATSHSKRSKRPIESNHEDQMAAAAFGCDAAATEGRDDDEDDDEDEDDDDDDEYEYEDDDDCGGDGERSEAVESSVAEGARVLPIRGETCVGCVCDRAIISTVDAFVRQNAVCMTETALYKAAALHYRNFVVAPRRRENVSVIPWKWKDIQAHYVLHVCDPLLQRAAAVRSLGAVRAVQEQQLMRHNPDGTKQLDQKGAELLLKIVALQDKQILALEQSRMPPPSTGGKGGGGR